MISSLILGALLGISYSLFVKKWMAVSPVAGKATSMGRHVFLAFFRIASIAMLFLGLSKVPFLDVFVVLISFIAVITFFIFNLARKAYMPMIKSGSTHS